MSVSLRFGESSCSASILVVDDAPDLADLFRQRFRVRPAMDRLELLGKFMQRHPFSGHDGNRLWR
jgi:hypothetical protein